MYHYSIMLNLYARLYKDIICLAWQFKEVAGLLKIQDGGRTFSAIMQNLQLYNQELDNKNPTDIVYCNGW